MLNEQQIYLFGQIQASQIVHQPYSDTDPHKEWVSILCLSQEYSFEWVKLFVATLPTDPWIELVEETSLSDRPKASMIRQSVRMMQQQG